jgi:hypothetical protein
MYENATASVQLNGVSVGQIPIQYAVRQGCSYSMALYVLCINPLLFMLNGSLKVTNLDDSRGVHKFSLTLMMSLGC